MLAGCSPGTLGGWDNKCETYLLWHHGYHHWHQPPSPAIRVEIFSWSAGDYLPGVWLDHSWLPKFQIWLRACDSCSPSHSLIPGNKNMTDKKTSQNTTSACPRTGASIEIFTRSAGGLTTHCSDTMCTKQPMHVHVAQALYGSSTVDLRDTKGVTWLPLFFCKINLSCLLQFFWCSSIFVTKVEEFSC